MSDGVFILRMIGCVATGLLTLLFLYAALTVPMISATTPTLFMLVCGAATWFLYPRRRNSESVS